MNLGLHNKNFANARSKKNMVKLGIPALDLSTLKNVKDYKDWYGYSQKLENAIRLLREKNEALEKDGDMKYLHIMKLEKDIEGLKRQVKSYTQQNKNLNDKYKELLEKNFKSTKQQDLEPIFKPIHSKTMSLVGMLKQYATSGQFSNEATERIFSPMRRDRHKIDFEAADNSKSTRRRSEIGLKGLNLAAAQKDHLQIVSDMQDAEEEDSDRAVERLGLKDISELGPPDLPKEKPAQDDDSFGMPDPNNAMQHQDSEQMIASIYSGRVQK